MGRHLCLLLLGSDHFIAPESNKLTVPSRSNARATLSFLSLYLISCPLGNYPCDQIADSRVHTFTIDSTPEGHHQNRRGCKSCTRIKSHREAVDLLVDSQAQPVLYQGRLQRLTWSRWSLWRWVVLLNCWRGWRSPHPWWLSALWTLVVHFGGVFFSVGGPTGGSDKGAVKLQHEFGLFRFCFCCYFCPGTSLVRVRPAGPASQWNFFAILRKIAPWSSRWNRTRQRPGPDNDHTIWLLCGPEILGPDNDHLGLDNDQSLCGPRHIFRTRQWPSPVVITQS